MPTDGAVGIETEPLHVSDGEQEQVKRPGAVVGAGQVMVTDYAVIHPTEAGRNATQPFGPQDVFADHGQVWG